MLKSIRKALVAGLALLGVTALTGQASAEAVTLQIDGTPTPYFAPFYMADLKDFYSERGLEVKFVYAEAADVIRNVAAGNVDFGLVNADAIITAAGKSLPISVVDTVYPKSIGALLFLGDSGITTPADLKGRKVGVTSLGSPNYVQLLAALEQSGLTVSDVDVTIIGPAAIAPALAKKEVDAIQFNTLRYYSLKASGVDVKYILSENFLPSFGNVLFVSKNYLERKPDTIKSMIDAIHEGIRYVQQYPEQSVNETIEKFAPERKDQAGQYMEMMPDLFPAGSEIFQPSDLKKWQAAIDAQAKYNLIPATYPASSLIAQ